MEVASNLVVVEVLPAVGNLLMLPSILAGSSSSIADGGFSCLSLVAGIVLVHPAFGDG